MIEIAVQGLTKVYGKVYGGHVTALKDIDLRIGPGMFGLLGPNGAGKTTLMRILATLLRPTSGTARVGGYRVDDPREKWSVKAMLGYLPQELALYGDLSACEFLDFVAALKELGRPQQRQKQVRRVLEITSLTEVADRRLKTCSGGMKRRVGIAQALLGNPSLLIVDEPTAGLDVEERVRFRNLLVELAQERLILLSTHIVEDVAHTCSQLAVLYRGRLLFTGSVTEMIDQVQGKAWVVEAPGYQPAPEAILVASTRTALSMQYRVLAGEQPHPAARPATPSLEDGYLWLMKTAESGTPPAHQQSSPSPPDPRRE
jgi:ABC-type multidrug transport system ATPase subunit